MKIVFAIILTVIILLAAIYIYFFFLRMIRVCLKTYKDRTAKIMAAAFLLLSFGLIFKYIGIGIISMFYFFLISAVLELLNFIIKRSSSKTKFGHVWQDLFKSGFLTVILLVAIIFIGLYNGQSVINTKYDVATDKALAKPLKIVMLSDLHMDTTMNTNDLSKYCREIDDTDPDLIILAGDMFDEGTSKKSMIEASRLLGSIKSTYGTYFVYGNHDTEECEAELKKNNIKVLRDKTVLVDDSFYIIGRSDASFTQSGYRADIDELLKNVDKSKFILLMDHQPIDLTKNAKAGIDLQLSGHTHGDQAWPLGFFSKLFNINEMVYGIKKDDNYNIIVSSGLGCWGTPFRLGSKSEIVYINVK